jgi:RNA polymerase sigma-70 factor (ECF subfamily)
MTMSMHAIEAGLSASAQRDAHRVTVVDLQARRGPELYGFARRLGLSSEEAGDAVQDALLRVWLALDGGTDIQHVDAWTFRTLYRLCMDHHRWRRRFRLMTERIHPAADAGAPGDAADRLSLWAAVDLLPERQRITVHLRYRADLTFEQIGDVLGIRPVSARSQVSRALDRLAELLDREDFR